MITDSTGTIADPSRRDPTTDCIHFEGHTLSLLEIDGRPAWIASEVGEAMGYADGRILTDLITGKWSDEMVDESDYTLLRGRDLQAAQGGFQPIAGTPPSMTGGRLLVLFETGLHLVLLKTTKPAGKRLRRFLAERVLPDLARGRSSVGAGQGPFGGAVDLVNAALARLPIGIRHTARIEEILELLKAEAVLGRELPHFRHQLGGPHPEGLTKDGLRLLKLDAQWRDYASTRPNDSKRVRE